MTAFVKGGSASGKDNDRPPCSAAGHMCPPPLNPREHTHTHTFAWMESHSCSCMRHVDTCTHSIYIPKCIEPSVFRCKTMHLHMHSQIYRCVADEREKQYNGT